MTDRTLFNGVLSNNGKKAEVLEDAENRSAQATRTYFCKLRVVFATVVCVLLLTACGFATGATVNSPNQAWRAAKTEFAKLQELGIVSEKITLDSETREIIEDEERIGNDYWFGRIFKHSYIVRCNSRGDGNKYFVNMYVDTASGKITCIWIHATADADEPIDTTRNPYKPDDSDWEVFYYRNFADIFPVDMTVDRLCSLLAQYWGFSGYQISGTVDSFYGYDTNAPDNDLLLTDICNEPYITVYFDGDQNNVPMYIELQQFPGKMSLSMGTRHGIG